MSCGPSPVLLGVHQFLEPVEDQVEPEFELIAVVVAGLEMMAEFPTGAYPTSPSWRSSMSSEGWLLAVRSRIYSCRGANRRVPSAESRAASPENSEDL